MALDRDPNHVFRDFVTAGLPSSGKWNPRKPEIRQLLTEWWQTLIALAADAGGLELPNLLIQFSVNPEEGDENNIVAEANLPVPAGAGVAVFSIVIEEANTGPVTINGKPLLSNTGNPLVAGALAADGIYLFLDNGESYRLLSDYVSAAIVAAAEGAAVQAIEASGTAVNAADRAETFAAGVEFPVSFAPQTLTPEQQEQARENIGAVSYYAQDLTDEQQGQARKNIGVITLLKPTARIRREWLDATRSYDVIEIKGANAGKSIRQVVNPEPGQPGVQRRIPLREFAEREGVPIAMNGMAFRNADGSPGWDQELVVPNGLMISDGQLISDWSSGTNPARDQAIVMQSDGFFVPAYRASSTGAGLVAAGAQFAISWGAFCVLDGSGIPNLNSGYMTGVVSARNVIGQRLNGDIIMVCFEGATSSYGVTPDEITPVMLALGCEIAFIVEGGGSVQMWWNSYYAHGSSDLEAPRTKSSAIIADALTENEYDSGTVVLEPPAWSTGAAHAPAAPLSIRQVGPNIYTRLNLAGFSAGGIITRIAPRYLPESPTEARGILNGGGGYIASVNMAGGANLGNFTATKALGLTYPDPSAVIGTVGWLQRRE